MLRRRYIIIVGACAILVPLAINMWAQYESLTELQETSPLARNASIERRVREVSNDLLAFYRDRAMQTLSVPPQAIRPDEPNDPVDLYFKDAPAEGISRYYLSAPYYEKDIGQQIKLSLYDPHTRSIVKLGGPPRPPEVWSAIAASTGFMRLIMKAEIVDPDLLVFSDADPDNLIIAKPITDKSSRVIGVAGMIVDEDYFQNVHLPRALPIALAKHFTEEELAEIAITVCDQDDKLVVSTQPGVDHDFDVAVPLQLAFSRWKLGVKTLGPTHETIAKQNFATNLTLMLLDTVVLLAGLGFAMRAASKELKISQMKSDFVSNVSHELRTPLSSIRVLGEFLRSGREIDPEKLRKYGEYIEAESTRLAKLINNILDFSKIESGQKTYRRQECQIEDIVAESLRVFEIRLTQRGFTIDIEAPEHPLPAVMVDPEAMGQAVSNLLDNAIKYSGASRTIRLTLSEQDGFVVVGVTDFGIGIPKDDLKKIFDRFHRVSTGLVHDVKGSGLGLSLVKHIVDAHGGTVTVASEIGKGSTFTMRLPALDPSDETQPETKESSSAPDARAGLSTT